ncbi:unnamed protein product [Closterium sp. NIES-53]
MISPKVTPPFPAGFPPFLAGFAPSLRQWHVSAAAGCCITLVLLIMYLFVPGRGSFSLLLAFRVGPPRDCDPLQVRRRCCERVCCSRPPSFFSPYPLVSLRFLPFPAPPFPSPPSPSPPHRPTSSRVPTFAAVPSPTLVLRPPFPHLSITPHFPTTLSPFPPLPLLPPFPFPPPLPPSSPLFPPFHPRHRSPQSPPPAPPRPALLRPARTGIPSAAPPPTPPPRIPRT